MKAPLLSGWVGGVAPNELFSFSPALLDVPLDDFCRNSACRAHVIAARPKMLLSTHLFEVGKLFTQVAR